MRKLMVILGAGASAGMGLPMLGQIFKDKEVARYLTTNAHTFLRFLEDYIWQPRGVTIHESDSSLNIEEILTLLRQWERQEVSPLSIEENRVIQRQLLGCVPKGVYTEKGSSDSGRYLNRLVEHVDSQYDEVSWASFNWDMKFEQAFWHFMKSRMVPPLNRLPRCNSALLDWDGSNPKHYLMKLHGSVSWFTFPDQRVHNKRFGARKPTPIDVAWDEYLGGGCTAVPVIAEPSFFKHEVITAGTFLWKQWEDFNSRLATAHEILVCGYSLPDGDAKAKESCLTCVAVNPKASWTVVDPSNSVLEKFGRLVGGSRVTSHCQRLGDYVNGL
ncbi:MAG: hypothetical protein H7Y17_15785 [Chlorobia bacterium]|nr:hypothetical protein [Fimbriimonadaceae bacterium]